MPKLYVIPGHGDGDPGACANGFSEAERVRALASRIKDFGGDEVELSDFSRNCYKDSGILSWGIPEGVPVVELHMDSAVPEARGGHVIVHSALEPDGYDRAIAGFVSSIFPGRSNAIQGRRDLQNVNQAKAAGVNYRLVENGFISNAGDVETFNARIDEIARKYCEVFGISPSEDVVEEPSPSAQASGDFHGGAYVCTVDCLNIRKSPSTGGEICGGVSWGMGDVVYLDDWYSIADGLVWGRYTGQDSGELRYVAIGRATGKPEADDYLVEA